AVLLSSPSSPGTGSIRTVIVEVPLVGGACLNATVAVPEVPALVAGTTVEAVALVPPPSVISTTNLTFCSSCSPPLVNAISNVGGGLAGSVAGDDGSSVTPSTATESIWWPCRP